MRFCFLFLMVWMAQSENGRAALPTFQEVRARDESSEILLLDRQGQAMDSYRLNPHYRKAPWVKLPDFSPLARKILVEIEDQRFFEHSGVDWFSLGRSALTLLGGDRTRGASTITMQLVSLIDPKLARNGRRSVSEKTEQVKGALQLEKTWTKDQILEAYLNLVPLRGEWIGIHSVAHFLFKKTPDALDPTEAAVVVAMLPSPNQPWNKITERACVFLKHVYVAEPDLAASLCIQARKMEGNLEAAGDPGRVRDRMTEHYTRAFVQALPKAKRRGGVYRTTIDLNLQQKVYEYAKESLLGIAEKNVGEIAALVIDHKTGEVLTYVGNLQRYSKSEHVDGVRAKRQAGSTLKPFFYALAFQNKKFDLQSTLVDEPIQVQTSNGAFRPENYDHEFHGRVGVATALASSLNIPAIKVVQEVGVEESVALLKKLGISGLKSAYIYGPSIALGTVDVTLEELTRAYAGVARAAFSANDEKRASGANIKGATFPLSPEASAQVTRILSDHVSRSLTFGMNSVLATPYFTAVKTGTSQDMRDNWCVGYSDRYAVGVWVGNFTGAPMHDVSGVSGAAPLWRKVMDHLHRNTSSGLPPAIARISIPEMKPESPALVSGEAGKNLSPVRGTNGAAGASMPKIVYPHAGSILAVDPEIPSEQQRVLLKASEKSTEYDWVLNGEKLGPLSAPYLWLVKQGQAQLEIRDRGGRVMDEVRFLVR